MSKITKKLACMALTVVMGLTTLAGCGNTTIDGTKAFITYGEDVVTMGTANLMVRMSQATMMSYFSMFGGATTGIWGQDAGDGKTYAESTKDGVEQQIKDMLLLKRHAKEYGVSVSEEENKKIEETAKSFMEANKEETIKKLAVSQADIEQYLTLQTYSNRMYAPMTADVDTDVEDSEATQSKITYSRVDISDKTNEDGTTTPLTDEEKQEKKEQAQKILDKFQEAGDMELAELSAAVKEIEEKSSANEMAFDDEDTVLDDKVKEIVKNLKDGEVYKEVIEGENGYYVVRMDHVLDREATDKEKEKIVNERKQKAYSEILEKWNEEAKMTVDKKEWEKVTLTDNDQYTIKQPKTEESAE